MKDVGPPQLSMHSCREMMATRDVASAVKLFATAFRTYGEVAKAIDLEGCPSDPFWAEPGNGWGLNVG